jgi:adenosylcobinamide hydrolase
METDHPRVFETTIRDGVFCARREGTRWLSTGWNGGRSQSSVAYNITVPTGFEETDIEGYAAGRRREAGFDERGPTLLTGVSMDHARGARAGPVEVYATIGLSNPTALSMEPSREWTPEDSENADIGTVNLLVGTTRALTEGALANLVAVAAAVKAETLLSATGFSGTSSDAVVVGCDPDGESTQFTGSATEVGAATRACVRDALLASLHSRYPDGEFPDSVADAEYGVTTNRRADVFVPD